MSAAPDRLAPGQAVRVRDDWPETRGPCHVRTPHYLRGRAGRVARHLGDFPDPGELAFDRPASRRALYHVAFEQPPVFGEGRPGDALLVEVFDHWLEALPEGAAR